MIKILGKYSVALSIAFFLVLSFHASIFGQYPERGCVAGANEFALRDNTYWFEDLNGKPQLVDRAVLNDRVLTGNGRFLFESNPYNVQIFRDGNPKIIFTPTLPASADGELYAVFYRAPENSSGRPQLTPNEMFVPYNGRMPADGETINATLPLRPGNQFSDGGQVISGISDNFGTREKQVSIRKLKRVAGSEGRYELDASDLADGFYWFTLQGKVGGGTQQNSSNCTKTTAPVVIQMTPTPTPPPTPTPVLSLDVKINKPACQQPVITANITYKGEPQNLTLRWEISGSNTPPVEKSLGAVTTYQETITPTDLTPGNYAIDVRVTTEDGLSKFFRQDFNLDCAGAKVIYFQFAEPYDSIRGGVYRVGKYLDPVLWTNYYRKGQCVEPYAGQEYPNFYTRYVGGATAPSPIKPNREKLNEIVEILATKLEYRLQIFGFADRERGPNYSNDELSKRRIDVVKEYLIRALMARLGLSRKQSEARLSSALIAETPNGDRLAEAPVEVDRCAPDKRYDRRVELFFFIGNKPPAILDYVVVNE